MPRNGSGIYSVLPGTDGFPDTTIESAKYNSYIHDVEYDLNWPRPIVAGGTGANDANEALVNLRAEKSSQRVTNYDTHVFYPGSFYSDQNALGAPVYGQGPIKIPLNGTAVSSDPPLEPPTNQNVVIQGRDTSGQTIPGRLWVREKKAGVWGAWTLDNTGIASATPPANPPDNTLWWDNTTGTLYIYYNDGNSSQWVVASPQTDPNQFLLKAGDTMLGPLTLQSSPTTDLMAANKNYVDGVLTSGLASISTKVSKSGDTMTGALVVYNNITTVGGNIVAALTATSGTYYFGEGGTNYFALNGGVYYLVGGALNAAGVTVTNPAAPTTGAVNFGNAAGKYLYYSGTDYTLAGGPFHAEDITVAAPGATPQGAVRFGNIAGRYLYFDGANFQLTGGHLYTSHNIQSGSGVYTSGVADNIISSNFGYVILRPQGPASGAGQFTVDASGNVGASNRIALSAGSFVPPQGVAGGFNCKSGDANNVSSDYFNMHWVGSMALYVNTTFLGAITVSDYRTKKDVTPLPSTWDAVKTLKPIKYTQAEYTPPSELERSKETQTPFVPADNIERWGFLAHELQETLVGTAASGVKDQPNCLQTPNPMPVIAALTKALQEAMARIEALEAGV